MTLVLRSAISTREEVKRAVRRVPRLGEVNSMDSKTSRAPSERRPRTHWATCHSQNEGWCNRTSERRSSWVRFPCRNRGCLDGPYNSTVDQPRSANQCVGELSEDVCALSVSEFVDLEFRIRNTQPSPFDFVSVGMVTHLLKAAHLC